MQRDSANSRFPHTDFFEIGGQTYAAAEIIAVLGPLLTQARQQRIAQVVAQRTFSVLPVVEGAINTGNVNAVMRSAEALGYGAFHLIESERIKHSQRTSAGADKWLDVTRFAEAGACAEAIKQKGYRLVVTHLDGGVPLQDFDFTLPTALVFGNEAQGVSADMLAHADARCIIPMSGFVESFNISVAAALCLYHARQDRLARQGHHGDLTPEEQERLIAAYYLRSLPAASKILRRQRA